MHGSPTCLQTCLLQDCIRASTVRCQTKNPHLLRRTCCAISLFVPPLVVRSQVASHSGANPSTQQMFAIELFVANTTNLRSKWTVHYNRMKETTAVEETMVSFESKYAIIMKSCRSSRFCFFCGRLHSGGSRPLITSTRRTPIQKPSEPS